MMKNKFGSALRFAGKFTASVSAAALVLVSIPAAAVNEPSKKADNSGNAFKFYTDGKTATITEYTGAGPVVVIPSEFVNIPVTRIEDEAFSGCGGVVAVVIPDCVTSIGKKAFSACPDLVTVSVGSSVETIDDYAFSGCPELGYFTVHAENKNFGTSDGSLVSKDGEELIAYAGTDTEIKLDGFKKIGDGAFAGKLNITSVNTGEGVKDIGKNAFAGCVSLEKVYLDDETANISEGCFSGCMSLEEVRLSSKTEMIPPDAFAECTSLKYFTIPKDVKYIGDSAFFNCGELSGIYLPDSIFILGTNAFGRRYDLRTGEVVSIKNFIIHGSQGSYADRYAQSLSMTFKPFILGDVDDDGIVDASDATNVLSYSTFVSGGGAPYYGSYEMSASDWDGDGITDASDATGILAESTRLSAGRN